MHISIQWLQEYISATNLSTNEIANLLTEIGLEVEKIRSSKPLAAEIIVGFVEESTSHPESTKLSICTVDVGKKEKLTIVCGASNVRKGLKVAVATIGATLGENLVIKPSTIRGQTSQGMLCSEKELDLSDEDGGILELPNHYKVGSPLENYVRRQDDILELKITPNRGDCLSYIGIARDLAAKLGKAITLPNIDPNILGQGMQNNSDEIDVSIDQDVACSRFCALYMGNCQSVTSPLWLKMRLIRSGMRPISLFVDLANYLMLEYGQPVHTYDLAKLEGRKLSVKPGLLGQKITTLDGTERQITPADIVIWDSEKPVALGGIMGGLNSQIDLNSQELVLEIAHFTGTQVRKTAKRLGLSSEASARFEKGTDRGNMENVALRFAFLLNETHKELNLPIPQIGRKIINAGTSETPLTRIALRLDRVRKLLDLSWLSAEQCITHLNNLGLELADRNKDRLLFLIPSHRNDLQREIDLVEEIARMVGYDKIPYQTPRLSMLPNTEDGFISFRSKAKQSFAALGYDEVLTYPFISSEMQQKLGLEDNHPLASSICLQNPLNEEQPLLRASILPSLLHALSLNNKKNTQRARQFELGRCYYACNDAKKSHPYFALQKEHGRHNTPRAKQEAQRPIERTIISGIIDHEICTKTWNQANEIVNFYSLKRDLQIFFQNFAQNDWSFIAVNDDSILPMMHPGKSAWVMLNEQFVGFAGMLHPKCVHELKMGTAQIAVFELDLEAIYGAYKKALSFTGQVQRYPSSTRDFAFIKAKSQDFADIAKNIREFPGQKYLRNFSVFDLYEGEGIPAGKQSIALNFIFAAEEKTLTDKEIDQEAKMLVQWLTTQSQLTLRG